MSMAAELGAQKRPREEDSDTDSPVEKRIRFDLFEDILDESYPDPTGQDLDSVMKSLEEEISVSVSVTPSGSGSFSPVLMAQPELGYLLEASDDELGLPPSTVAEEEEGRRNEEAEVTREMLDFGGENWGFGEETGFGAAEFGLVDEGDGDYLALDGLFDYSDVAFGSADYSWLSESMSAQ